MPGRIRYGDINIDGYPDFCLTLSTDQGPYSMFLLSIEGSEPWTRDFNVTTDHPTFSELEPMISDSYLIAPFDVNEDGKLDILCQYLNPVTGKMDLKIIYNNIYFDSFFLKAMMSYDHKDTPELATHKSPYGVDTNDFHWGGKQDENTFGDNVIGASFRFVFTQVSDEKQVIAGR